jgi:hypothetical protein
MRYLFLAVVIEAYGFEQVQLVHMQSAFLVVRCERLEDFLEGAVSADLVFVLAADHLGLFGQGRAECGGSPQQAHKG